MKLATAGQMRAADSRAIREHGIPGAVLMDRAGHAVARCVQSLLECRADRGARILLAAGKGNNGGDAFAAARWLSAWGIPCEVWLAAERAAVAGDAADHLRRMEAAGVSLREKPREEDWDAAEAAGWSVVVDGLLGTGARGPARGVAAAAIRCLNRMSASAMVVAVDVPSGLDADTGAADGPAVEADVTVTFGFPKIGCTAGRGPACTGSLRVADIGIPAAVADTVAGARELVTGADVARWLPRRPRDAHKGTFGHALLVAGSREYPGAAALAVRAAVRSGAGLVTAWVPGGVAHAAAAAAPEAMVQGIEEANAGGCADAWTSLGSRSIDRFTAILAGPGMGSGSGARAVVRDLLARCRVPLVLDADALNVQRLENEWVAGAAGPVILTPHPGELARFLGVSVGDVQADRTGAAERTAERARCTVVLKGAGTIVAAPGRPTFLNLTGNPGMATGGCGDALAGLLVGLLAQGMPPLEAACAAVYLHGLAGDLAAWRFSQAAMKTGDLIEQIPHAFRQVSVR